MLILWIFVFILLLLVGAGYFLARVVMYPRVFSLQETYEKERDAGRFDEKEFLGWSGDEYTIRSPFGYDLAAVYYPLQGAQKTVVITHGITWSHYGSIKYAALFRKRGFNVLIYDLRNHGGSGGTDTSYGFYEKNDLRCMVDWAFAHLDPGGIVGTMGESLGAATTLQHAGIDPRIAFAVADCPFSDLSQLLADRLWVEFHLPAFPFLNLADIFVRRIAGWSFAQASPMHFIPTLETPVLFIHGQQDAYIFPRMSVAMYEAKQRGKRSLYLAPNAGHAEALVKNPQEYDARLGQFLCEIGLANG